MAPKRAHAGSHHEILHWNWLGASDKEVWSRMIDAFNDAHKDKGVQIKMEDVALDQYKTKILASVATGRAPDFGWGIAGQDAKFAKEGVTAPLDDIVAGVRARPRRFHRTLAQGRPLSAVRQPAPHDPDGSHEPSARDQRGTT